MKIVTLGVLLVLLSACQALPPKDKPDLPKVKQALEEWQPRGDTAAVVPPEAVQQALLPPAGATLGNLNPLVPTFDVSVNEVPARQFFMSLVEGTSDNMIVHPDVSGTLTLNLKHVTTAQVMDTVRDVYGYEYRYSHGVYQVFPAQMRSQVFKVNYLDIERKGGSRTRVSSGQVSQGPNQGGNSSNSSGATGGQSPPAGGNGSGSNNNLESFSGAQVTTRSKTDFWDNLETSLKLLVGEENGRRIIADPLSGTVLVHAMPRELLDIQQYLDDLQVSVNRQVIIEAKIVEVRLNDKFQAGINWTSLIDIQGGSREVAAGVFGTGLAAPFNNIANASRDSLGSVFALQAHLGDFDALLELLKNQGDVQVLSSPRVSTVNNQKAIIKVGTDRYFVTDVDVNTDVTTGVNNQSADVTLTPFFSGVALDVTPQIDEDGRITLHVHPAISEVKQEDKQISISSQTQFNLPLAASTIRESDTIVRAENGQVVVIGGLMQDLTQDDLSSTPFLGDLPVVGHMFRQTRKVSTKTELVILLRPMVVNGNQAWAQQLNQAQQRFGEARHMELP
ncbi:MAG: pilus (MSHA type) biogenesis protein MshL [Thiogranum sp.]|jgi:MSHA biogenesis protein MshL